MLVGVAYIGIALEYYTPKDLSLPLKTFASIQVMLIIIIYCIDSKLISFDDKFDISLVNTH